MMGSKRLRRFTSLFLLLSGSLAIGQTTNGTISGTVVDPRGAVAPDVTVTISQRKASEGWRRTVNEMIWRGAPLVAEEAEVITNYLAAAFGPDRPATKAAANASAEKEENRQWEKYLPAGAGRALVIQACAQCHSLKTVVAQRKTAAGWRRSAHEMMRLGAQLTASESETIADYFAASFKPDQPKGGQ
ncbi:MAG TPA: hypothetical protein VKE91_07090 [Blastocatellia bacterium]|nr:hypothetical protein [Blastocatellia bacterium]